MREQILSNSVLPIPVYLSCRKENICYQNVKAFQLLIVRKNRKYIAIVTESPYFDLAQKLYLPGAAQTRTFHKSRPADDVSDGWLWRGKITIPFPEFFYKISVDKIIGTKLPYSAYLKRAVRLAISRKNLLRKEIQEANATLQLSSTREINRYTFNGMYTSEQHAQGAALWDFSNYPAVIFETDSEENDIDISVNSTVSIPKDLEAPPGLHLQVVAPSKEKPLSSRGANKDVLDYINKGVERPIFPNPNPDCLKPLYDQFPNFVEALDKVSTQLHLLKRAGEPVPFKLRPMILIGESGVGKSHFAWELSKALGAPAREVDFATASAAFVLAGSSPQWADAKNGIVFDELINGPYANPIIIGNELDKSPSQEGSRFPATGPLYTLLESNTAYRFVDEFAETPINASFISWIFTANSLSPIPMPILLRTEIVNIPAPTKEHLLTIGLNIYQSILKAEPWGDTFPATLNSEILELISRVGAPRLMKSLMWDALGKAARAGATCIQLEHIIDKKPLTRVIGFM